jgi:hypothetical protein
MSSKEIVYKKDGLDIYEEPQKNKYYVIAADTSRGIGGDYSAFVVVDITEMPFRVVGKYRDNKVSPLLYPDFISRVAGDYNNAYVLIENNDIGQQVVDILHQELEYENIFSTVQEKNKQYVSPGFGKSTTLGVRTSKAVKRQGCLSLKSLVEETKFLIWDADCINELSTFVERGGSFSADEGYHDDLAMCMVLFAWLTTNTFFKDLTNVDIREGLYNAEMRSIQNDLTPFGFVEDGLEPEAEVIDGDYWMWANERKDFL